MRALCYSQAVFFFKKALFFFERMCYNTNKATTAKSERGEILAKAKRRRKLLIQTALIILPAFTLMIAAVVWVVYISSINSYLKAQDKQINDTMTILTDILIPQGLDDPAAEWCTKQLETVPADGGTTPTAEEEDHKMMYFQEENSYTSEWYLNMPEDVARLWMREQLTSIKYYFDQTMKSSNFDSLMIIDKNNTDQTHVLLDLTNKDLGDLSGSYYDFDLSKHPVLQQALEAESIEMLYEKTEDFPVEGNFYIGYRPVVVNGKTIAVIGLTYNWNDLRSSVINTIINAVVIIVSGMILLMILLLVFLYRKAIRPVSNIQNGLIEYADSKDSAQIVNKMLGINSNNELGYLADTISDMALEIDHYTKENVRIAVERERAETERERAEKEAYEAKVAVMASQIRPHFMYNALTSIAMMCQIDPEKAQEATINFAKYLRGNMDSLKQTKPVPFEVELEHLKKYLYIEKLRFGKKLNVEYDIQATDFKLPMLSVQPLAENAVKHGVGMKKNGGTVTIISRDTGNAFEVIIKDDGVGFDTNAPKKDDGRSHVGMENTRSRLKEMCDGTVNIESTVDVGTTATIILPKEGQNNEDTVS